MSRKLRIAAITAAIVLSGCQPATNWRDTSGMHRDIKAAEADFQACVGQYPSATPNVFTHDETQQLVRCMAAKNWAYRWSKS